MCERILDNPQKGKLMNFNLNKELSVVALLGAGSMGCAIVCRVGAGKKYSSVTSAKTI